MKHEKSLAKAFKEIKQWLAHAESEGRLDRYESSLQNDLSETGILSKSARVGLDGLGHYYGIQACDAFGKQDVQNLARSLKWAIAFRSLQFRFGSLSGVLCARHSMTTRSIYANEQDEVEERGHRGQVGGAAVHPQGAA